MSWYDAAVKEIKSKREEGTKENNTTNVGNGAPAAATSTENSEQEGDKVEEDLFYDMWQRGNETVPFPVDFEEV